MRDDGSCRSLRPAAAARVDRPDGRRRNVRPATVEPAGARGGRRATRRTPRRRLRRRRRHRDRRRGQRPPGRTAAAAVRDGRAVRAPRRQLHHGDRACTSWAVSAAPSGAEPRTIYARSTTTCKPRHAQLFGRLVAPATARPTPAGGPGSASCRRPTRTVADRFVQARLLVADRDLATREPVIEVAHEALLTNWPRLREWLEADRRWLAQLQHLATATRSWDESGRPDGELYRAHASKRCSKHCRITANSSATTSSLRRRQSNGARCRPRTRATQHSPAPTTARCDRRFARPRPHCRWYCVDAAPTGPRLTARQVPTTVRSSKH